jgi:hypothetical protein
MIGLKCTTKGGEVGMNSYIDNVKKSILCCIIGNCAKCSYCIDNRWQECKQILLKDAFELLGVKFYPGS